MGAVSHQLPTRAVRYHMSSQKAAFPVDFLLHHFFLLCVFVSNFEDAKPETFCEVFATLGAQISCARVPTMSTIGVVTQRATPGLFTCTASTTATIRSS